MKKFYIFLMGIMVLPWLSFAQTSSASYAVQISAVVNDTVPSITLVWPKDKDAANWSVYRKKKTDTYWGKALATLAASDTFYADDNVSAGIGYEYRVIKTVSGGSYKGYGYIYAGMKLPMVESRGKILLLIDSTFMNDLSAEINQLKMDLVADGWMVITRYAGRKQPVTSVKDMIVKEFSKDRKNFKTVFILGHVPVPYSGSFAIDGHTDHKGAWPADMFYGDVDGNWSDYTVNDTSASDPRNYNRPGDGKYDDDLLPSDLELQIGRVDFNNMPAFTEGELALMKRYLQKDHAWRMGLIKAEERGLVQDNFGIMSGEAFAASGYKSFAPMFGYENVFTKGYFANLTSNSYLWSYGTGGGTFTSASGIVTTTQFAADSFQTVFTMLFGSYFGDWDSKNNLLRAAIANKGPVLTSAWSGRPHWGFHHMALGETIGYDTWVTQNNYTSYWRSIFLDSTQRVVTPALMGDPSLRMHILMPVKGFKADNSDYFHVKLSWSKTDEAIEGYFIYRSASMDSAFVRLNDVMITDTTFTDIHPLKGRNIYMVRAEKLQKSASGSYYNMSEGSFDTLTTTFTSIADAKSSAPELRLYPNPSKGRFYLSSAADMDAADLSVRDINGRLIFQRKLSHLKAGEPLGVNLSSFSKGLYLLELKCSGSVNYKKLILD